jgi:hypothetical protein
MIAKATQAMKKPDMIAYYNKTSTIIDVDSNMPIDSFITQYLNHYNAKQDPNNTLHNNGILQCDIEANNPHFNSASGIKTTNNIDQGNTCRQNIYTYSAPGTNIFSRLFKREVLGMDIQYVDSANGIYRQVLHDKNINKLSDQALLKQTIERVYNCCAGLPSLDKLPLTIALQGNMDKKTLKFIMTFCALYEGVGIKCDNQVNHFSPTAKDIEQMKKLIGLNKTNLTALDQFNELIDGLNNKFKKLIEHKANAYSGLLHGYKVTELSNEVKQLKSEENQLTQATQQRGLTSDQTAAINKRLEDIKERDISSVLPRSFSRR